MLTITVPSRELFNDDTGEFIQTKEYTLQLEHSLVSLSKWESKWKKPFLTKGDKSNEETLDYIRCMTITQNVTDIQYALIPKSVIEKISEYIDAPMTATTIHNMEKSSSKEVITAEIVYYWMIAFNIPFECQKWHLNRLLTLISVCNIKNQPPKKINKKDLLARQRALNEERKAKYHTRG